MPELFKAVKRTFTFAEGPPHFGKRENHWIVEGNVAGRKMTKRQAGAVAERLNAALEPLAGFDARGNPLEVVSAGS